MIERDDRERAQEQTDQKFNLRRLAIEICFCSAITTTLGFNVLVAPTAGPDYLTAVDHVV